MTVDGLSHVEDSRVHKSQSILSIESSNRVSPGCAVSDPGLTSFREFIKWLYVREDLIM